MAGKRNPLSSYKQALTNESFAGVVLLIAAVIALIWSNSPVRSSYFAISEYIIGPASLHLAMPVATWASDGILALFFFVVGLELKQEFTTGSLHDPRKAAVPILAALFGMLGPIGVYVLVQHITGSGEMGGWAVPVATDIAFALAVLAIFGKGLPPAARAFLMALAVADDLGGILVIGIFFSNGINFLWLLASLASVAVFGVLVHKRIIRWWLLWPLGILAWYFMHSAGIHATIAGVLLGMVVPARPGKGEKEPLTHRLTDACSFASSGFVLPIFAFFAAGVNLVDSGGFGAMLTDPVAMGIYLGLPLGKCIGIFGGVWLLTRVFRLRLGNGIDLADIFPVSLVAGIGFTVSLLIAYLSFDATNPHEPHARVAVILGSLISMLLGALALKVRLATRERGTKPKRRGSSAADLGTPPQPRRTSSKPARSRSEQRRKK
ncbi:Na+/H+ antiporter NhaA [Arcanobacterium haemolyticum]|nr:Na+/H+ antiporter NhaA [Arcanobacterium haemolyticum]